MTSNLDKQIVTGYTTGKPHSCSDSDPFPVRFLITATIYLFLDVSIRPDPRTSEVKENLPADLRNFGLVSSEVICVSFCIAG